MFFGRIGSRLVFLGFAKGDSKQKYADMHQFEQEGFTNVQLHYQWPSDGGLLPFRG